MDDLERLAEAVAAFPREATPRAMYVDELMARTGCSETHAKRVARDIWRPALLAWQVTRAVELVKGRDHVARRLQWAINRTLPVSMPVDTRVIVTTGGRKPVANPDETVWFSCLSAEEMMAVVGATAGDQLIAYPQTPFVLVGAAWVIRKAEEWQLLDAPRASAEFNQLEQD